jgi:SOS-response transcriptional repressor LexA
LSIAHWHNTPAPIRRQVEALESTRRAAVTQLRELLERGAPRSAEPGAKRTPSMVLDELWRTGRLQSLVDRLAAPDDPSAGGPREDQPRARAGAGGGGNVRTLPLSGAAEIPLINSVAAGYPRDFTDLGYPARVADSYVRSPDIADPDAFACRVVGDSMTPEYREGDIVIFSPARDIKSGMDCFVRLEPDHEATFKRIFFEDKADAPAVHIRLQPLNPHYPARTVSREQVAGLYAAVSVTRRLG